PRYWIGTYMLRPTDKHHIGAFLGGLFGDQRGSNGPLTRRSCSAHLSHALLRHEAAVQAARTACSYAGYHETSVRSLAGHLASTPPPPHRHCCSSSGCRWS